MNMLIEVLDITVLSVCSAFLYIFMIREAAGLQHHIASYPFKNETMAPHTELTSHGVY